MLGLSWLTDVGRQAARHAEGHSARGSPEKGGGTGCQGKTVSEAGRDDVESRTGQALVAGCTECAGYWALPYFIATL